MEKVYIRKKRICGKVRFYPVNDTAFVLLSLTQHRFSGRKTKTFNEQEVKAIYLLAKTFGFEVYITNDED